MHNLILHYTKGKWVWIGLLAFMLTCQALVIVGTAYGVDAVTDQRGMIAKQKVLLSME